MLQDDKFLEIKKLSDLSSKKWEDIRSPESYDYENLSFSFGIRRVAKPSSRTKLLQASRGQSYGSDVKTYDDFLLQYKKDSEFLHDFDKYRILEIINLHNNGDISLKGDMKFYELGFRSTAVLDYWKDRFAQVGGCDVVKPCVDASKDLGYNTELVDLNVDAPNLSDVSLVAAYHVLEHISNPLECLARLHKTLPSGAVVHIEIPVEPDGPRIRYGHLFPFHPDDLRSMLQIAGFRIVHYTNTPFSGGPAIERAVAVKD